MARLSLLNLAVLGRVLVLVIVARVAGVQYDPATYTFEGLLKTLLLVQAWFRSFVGYNWSGPSWSLSAEWFAYLLFTAYALIAMKLKTRPWALLFRALGLVLVPARLRGGLSRAVRDHPVLRRHLESGRRSMRERRPDINHERCPGRDHGTATGFIAGQADCPFA